MPFPLILASTSKYRGALMAQLGWEFEAMAPGVDEDRVKAEDLTPEQLATLLARLKAEAVFVKRSDACVIGSDQVCCIDGKILGKPGTIEKAVEQISFMQGKSHQLHTAVTIIYPGGMESILSTTTLHMRPLTFSQIHAYIKEDLPLDCAGSYKLESKGIKLFHHIEMSDQTSIIGLPLMDLTTALLKIGYPL